METNAENEQRETGWIPFILPALYCGVVNQILFWILRAYFAFNAAATLTVSILLLIGYPLFIRGTGRGWKKDGPPWRFFPYLRSLATIIIPIYVITTALVWLGLFD